MKKVLEPRAQVPRGRGRLKVTDRETIDVLYQYQKKNKGNKILHVFCTSSISKCKIVNAVF